MCWIIDEYVLSYKGKNVGYYYVFDNDTYEYDLGHSEDDLKGCKRLLAQRGLREDIDEADKPIPGIAQMMREENRVKGRKRLIYDDGTFVLTRVPQETGKRFLVYKHGVEKGQRGYSEVDHSAPHRWGPSSPEDMRDWTTWYAFEKMDDGTFVAALDESWWCGGGHNEGGTIRTEIPEEWFELSYDEFLEKVVTLSSAAHYGFTPKELKAKRRLKKFLGF